MGVSRTTHARCGVVIHLFVDTNHARAGPLPGRSGWTAATCAAGSQENAVGFLDRDLPRQAEDVAAGIYCKT